MTKGMDLKRKIVAVAKERRSFTANDVLEAIGKKFTRAYVLRFIGQLLESGTLVKSGSTRGAEYALKEKVKDFGNRFHKRYVNKGLHEDEIYAEVLKRCPFITKLPKNVQDIYTYAFTEMLNNAIDHSSSRYVAVKADERDGMARFVVDDYGVGAWNNIITKRKLNSEIEAVQDLLKGKTTTAPEAHSGEGIFFTSKAADDFILASGGTELRIDNEQDDTFVGVLKPRKNGTRVTFLISPDHRGTLSDVFRRFYTDPNELAFDKTEVQVKLYALGSQYVSRSQARRVLSGLEKFKSVILDFDRVSGVGQAFADEIFRVFASRHPDIAIVPKNMNEAVAFMVGRVEKPKVR